MDKLRRTLSFRSRKKKRKETESAKPHQWQEDERKVREGTCSFQVKYLGCVEVFESRGMQVCEEAHKILRQNAKKSQRLSFRKKNKKRQRVVQAIIYVSGDSLRVIEEKASIASADDGQGLIVDQTIEKVSFCAPAKNHEKAFAYICRDGTTRRWMCHGFLALKESGERLSHAVGCAFAVCLEKKQKREKEAVSVSYNEDKTSFSRLGSFRQATLTERLADPQSTKVVEPAANSASPSAVRPNIETAQVERPHASANLLLRQGSFNTFNKLNSQNSPFKRNLSLRLNELPSNLSRQQADFDKPVGENIPIIEGDEELESPQPATLASALTDTAPQKPSGDAWDPIAEMCQQLTKGLTGLNSEEPKSAGSGAVASQPPLAQSPAPSATVAATNGAHPIQQTNPWAAPAPQENDFWLPPSNPPVSRATIGQAPTVPKSSFSTSITTTTSVVSPHIRPRPTTTSALSQPFSHNPSLSADQFKQPTQTSNQQSTNINLTNGSMPSTGLVGVPVANPQNPFDTAWALRSNTSTNPFLASTTPSAPVSASSTKANHFNKEFELKM
ncbi:hypothetical protein EB796_015231 [Bugula neritina]|uniref:PID domain-containing protein n=1 Tax=Bugula neritina TaxID=10212 RepID=A0A7J7JK65_BUGNE|nr:hypothetical protein EB796_015231 [Bugula neritina]